MGNGKNNYQEGNGSVVSERSNIEKWRQLAEKSLKGKKLESLAWMTPEGIPVKPLYTAEDLETLECVNTLPGIPPLQQGPSGNHVCSEAMDDPAVCRMLHGKGIE